VERLGNRSKFTQSSPEIRALLPNRVFGTNLVEHQNRPTQSVICLGQSEGGEGLIDPVWDPIEEPMI
jgi:hypothetical protein